MLLSNISNLYSNGFGVLMTETKKSSKFILYGTFFKSSCTTYGVLFNITFGAGADCS